MITCIFINLLFPLDDTDKNFNIKFFKSWKFVKIY